MLQNKKPSSREDLLSFTFSGCGRIIKPSQVESEISNLTKIVEKNKPQYLLEIGTACGGTLFLFTRLASPNAKIISIDLPPKMFKGGYPLWKKYFYKSFASQNQEINLLRADSHDVRTLDAVKEILKGKQLDFLFLDGDHSYEGVKKDFEMYAPLVKNGGVIALHDIALHPTETGCEVNKFWDEIKPIYKSYEFIEDKDQKWAGIGVVEKSTAKR